MLEIILLILLYKVNSQNAVKRGRKPALYSVLTFVLWIGFEFLAVFIAAHYFDEFFEIYPFGILGAGIGALISFLLAKYAPRGEYIPPVNTGSGVYTPAFSEPLSAPSTIQIFRDKAFSASLVSLEVRLNGMPVGHLSNGGSISAVTNVRQNAVSVITGGLFGNATEMRFDVRPGDEVFIYYKFPQFVWSLCRNIYPYTQTPYTSNGGSAWNSTPDLAPQPYRLDTPSSGWHQPGPDEIRCHECGQRLLKSTKFCVNCGARQK